MYPNQSPEQEPAAPEQQYQAPPVVPPQSDAAYFDSIATPIPKKTMSPIFLWSVIVGFLLLLVTVFFLITTSGGPSKSEQFAAYVYRVQALTKLTKDSSKTIKSSELRALSASTTSILTGAEQESTAVLGAVNLKKLPSEPKTDPVTAEFTELGTKFNDARLNVTFDRVYSREIGYQLAKIRAEMSSLYASSKNNNLRTYLEKTDSNLKPLVTQYNAFNNSQS